MHLPLCRFLRSHLGPSLLDLPTRTLPPPRPRQSRRARHLRKLGIQFRTIILRPARLRQHNVASLHPLRRLPRRHVHPRLLHVPRDRHQDPRGGRIHLP